MNTYYEYGNSYAIPEELLKYRNPNNGQLELPWDKTEIDRILKLSGTTKIEAKELLNWWKDYTYKIEKALMGFGLDDLNEYMNIKPKVAEKVVNDVTYSLLSQHLMELKKLQDNGVYNTTVTNSEGNFKFYGLDPSKSYIVKFTYNGMRYEDVIANVNMVNGSTVSNATSSKAEEIIIERNELIERFKEIGTYPFNYKTKNGTYNTAFTQIDVEKALQEGKKEAEGSYIKLYLGENGNGEIYESLSTYIKDSNYSDKGSIVQFIKDTTISAQTSPVGSILGEALDKVKANNQLKDQKTKDIVYPIVVKKYISDYSEYSLAKAKYDELIKKEDSKIIGYEIIEIQNYKEKEYKYLSAHPSHPTEYKETTNQGVSYKWINYKTEEKEIKYNLIPTINLGICGKKMEESEHKCEAPVGNIVLRDWYGTPVYTLNVFRITDGYSQKTENNILFGVFGIEERRTLFYRR